MSNETTTDTGTRGPTESEGPLADSRSNNSTRYDKQSKKNYYKARKPKDKDKGVTTNSPEWYSKYPELLESSANLNYSDPFGKVMRFPDLTINGHNMKSTGSTIHRGFPGVLAVKTKPSFGYNDSTLSPLNVAANALYVNLRYKVSGRKNYDPVDLMLYMGAISELYSFVNWAARCYALAFTASQTNYYIMEGVAKACHIHLRDLRHNLSNFRMWLNTFIEKTSAFAIPKGITYFDKKVSQYSDLFIENNDNNIKDQLYINIPDGFFRFNLDNAKAGMLEFKPINYDGSPLRVPDIMQIGEDLISTIWGDEDFGIMSGDMIKAYEGNIIGLTTIDEASYLNPIYDELYLLQLKNSTIVSRLDDFGTISKPHYTAVDGNVYTREPGYVYQNDKGVLMSYNSAMCVGTPSTLSTLNRYIFDDKLMTQISPKPGLGDNIEASRQMVTQVSSIKLESNAQIYGLITGAYIVCGLEYVVAEIVGEGHLPTFNKYNSVVSNEVTMTEWLGNLNNLMIPNFKFHPSIFALGYNEHEGNYDLAYSYLVTGCENYTWVDSETLKKMHQCAWLSLFHVDGVAMVKNSLI